MIKKLIAMSVMTIAMVMFASVVASSARMGSEKREASIAANAARTLLETMRSVPFRQRFAAYNAVPADDPGGANSAPGCFFAVEGLELRQDDGDGFVGEVLFAADEGALYEYAENERLGMPRDLNADTLIDKLDHGSDYTILPVAVRIEWRGPNGPRKLEMFTMFVDAVSVLP